MIKRSVFVECPKFKTDAKFQVPGILGTLVLNQSFRQVLREHLSDAHLAVS